MDFLLAHGGEALHVFGLLALTEVLSSSARSIPITPKKIDATILQLGAQLNLLASSSTICVSKWFL